MRHLSRHLQSTVQDHVLRHLTELGWVGAPATVPFGALPVTFQKVAPREEQLASITPNLVAVSFGRQTDDEEEEMGGPLISQEHVFFVDIYAENEGIGLALSEDVRDLLVGRASYGTRPPSRYVTLENYSTSPPTPVPGFKGEFTDVLRTPADRVIGNYSWQVVSGSISLFLFEVAPEPLSIAIDGGSP